MAEEEPELEPVTSYFSLSDRRRDHYWPFVALPHSSTGASQRSRHSVCHSGKKPKHLFGVAVGLGEAYSTGLDGKVHQRC